MSRSNLSNRLDKLANHFTPAKKPIFFTLKDKIYKALSPIIEGVENSYTEENYQKLVETNLYHIIVFKVI